MSKDRPAHARTLPHKQGKGMEGLKCPSCSTTMNWLFGRHVCPECYYAEDRTEGGMVPKGKEVK